MPVQAHSEAHYQLGKLYLVHATMMAHRQSSRLVATSEKALTAARDVFSARQPNYSSSVSFRVAGESYANEVVELPEFKDNCLSCEGSDGGWSIHGYVVALSQKEAKGASTNKPFRPRHYDRSYLLNAYGLLGKPDQ